MKTFLLVLFGFALTSAFCDTVRATSMAPAATMNGASLVQLIDGKDKNDTVAIRASIMQGSRNRGKQSQGSHFDFGFMNGDSFVALTGYCDSNGIHDFSAGTAVDFALRQYGSDGKSGTGDDMIYRLSDSAGYATQTYFGWTRPDKSRNPVVPDDYFRGVRISWDLDLDDKTDIRTLIVTNGHSRFDGLRPANSAAPVPIPAALWLMASGLLGLAGFIKGSKTRHR